MSGVLEVGDGRAEDVCATRDVALAFNSGAGRRLTVEHWQDAVDQGAVAAWLGFGLVRL